MRERRFGTVNGHRTHSTTRHHLVVLMRTRLANLAEAEHFQQRLDRVTIKLGLAAHSAKTGLLMEGERMPSMASLYGLLVVASEQVGGRDQ